MIFILILLNPNFFYSYLLDYIMGFFTTNTNYNNNFNKHNQFKDKSVEENLK